MNAVSPEERILAGLRLEEPDRVPIFPAYSFVSAVRPIASHVSALPSSVDKDFIRLVDCARKIGDLMETWQPHVEQNVFLSASKSVRRWTSCYSQNGYEVEEVKIETPKGLMTSVRKTPKGGAPRVVKHLMECDEDVDKFLSVPYEPPEVDASSFSQFRAKLRGRAVVRVGAPTPIIEVAGPLLFNSDKFVIEVFRHRDKVIEMLDMMHERCIDYLSSLLSQGVKDAVFWLDGAELAAPPIFSPHVFDEFVVRYLKEIVKLIHEHDCVVIMHCHGNVNKILESIAVTGVDGLHPVEPPPMGDTPLSEAKKRIGHHVCLTGNIEMHDIITVSSKEIDAKVREAIGEGAPGGGFILSPSTGFYTFYRTPKSIENYMQFLKTGHEVCTYPYARK